MSGTLGIRVLGLKSGEVYVLLASSKSQNLYFKRVDKPDYIRCQGSEVYEEDDIVLNETISIDL